MVTHARSSTRPTTVNGSSSQPCPSPLSGLPDELHGEEVCAVVVPAPGTAPDAAGITARSKEHLGRHKYPRRVEFTDAMPLGPSLKVLKRELRAQYAERT